jgi:hypothetical protein
MGRVVSALCADSLDPQARRYIHIPNSAWAVDFFPECILGWIWTPFALDLASDEP